MQKSVTAKHYAFEFQKTAAALLDTEWADADALFTFLRNEIREYANAFDEEEYLVARGAAEF